MILDIKPKLINRKGESGSTPLHKAESASQIGIAKLLIENGANVNAKDNKGKTPLALAIQRNNKEIIDLLKKHGAVRGEDK